MRKAKIFDMSETKYCNLGYVIKRFIKMAYNVSAIKNIMDFFNDDELNSKPKIDL
jgi:hypothetical protein